MFCTNCGKELDSTAKFCPNCGTKIQQSNNQPDGHKVPKDLNTRSEWEAQLKQRFGQQSGKSNEVHSQFSPASHFDEAISNTTSVAPNTTIPTATNISAEIPAKDAKKPLFKRIWFWIIVAVVAILIMGRNGSSEDTHLFDPTTGKETVAQKNENKDAAEVEIETTQSTAAMGTSDNPYTEGMYKVGSDLPAGEYLFIAFSSTPGYVCVSSDSNQDDIIENENFKHSFFVTVSDGQYLEASRCNFVVASDYTLKINDDGSFDEGMYRVGIDIPAGEYKLTTSNTGYYCIYGDSIAPFDIISNDNFNGNSYVTVTDGQYLFIIRCSAKPV